MPNMTSMKKSVAQLFESEGFSYMDPPTLFDADVFLDLIGEDVGSRLFRMNNTDGRELCLRPDFTIPVSLTHMKSSRWEKKRECYYAGPIYRKRQMQIGEIQQAGAELIGEADLENADARMFELACNAVKLLGLENPAIKIGDEYLFSSVVRALEFPIPWQNRLLQRFGNRTRLDQAITQIQDVKDNNAIQNFLIANKISDPKSVVPFVEEILNAAGVSGGGGRTVGDIAELFIEKALLASRTKEDAEKAKLLSQFLNIRTKARNSVESLRKFEKKAKINISDSIKRYQRRLNILKSKGFDLNRVKFESDLGRNLSYYSGFTFEFYNPDVAEVLPLAGGGRYDRLFNLLGAKKDVPAIGFTMWLERFG